MVASGQYNINISCPYCTREIPSQATQCPWCCVVYDSDTLKFLRLMEYEASKQENVTNRKHVRFPKTLKVTYPSTQSFEESITSNLSIGGLFIRTTKPLDRGEQINLRISIPEEQEALEALCEVIWARKGEDIGPKGKEPPGMGVKFLNLSKEATNRFIGLLGRGL
jgi:type IV pilus assembly protein PilZ